MTRWTLAALVLLLSATGVSAQDLTPPKQTAFVASEALIPEVRRLSMALWDHAEIGLREDDSAEVLAAALEAEGFTVERDVAGLPTAFVASYGSGAPRIGVLAEYDALPGVGNAPVPRREPRGDGVTNGHGCGHNLFGAASVAGAIAIKRALEAHNLPGTVRLYGTPAEETLIGKVYMAREGLFDDLDAAIDWHPSTITGVRNQRGRAMNNFQVQFFGQAAHAASDPWNGRSALDAAEMMNYGANMMREHVRPTARIHYVIPRAGQAPNVVPEYAMLWYYVRDVDRASVEQHYARLLQIAEGAALATNTTHEVTLLTGVHEMLLNRPLQEAMQANLDYIGAPTFTEEEHAFARALQREVGGDEDGYSTDVQALADDVDPPRGGSTDVAEVSRITPSVGFSVTTAAQNIPWHSWAATASHGTEAGVKGAVVATKAIALMGLDLFTDAALRAAAREAFEAGMDGATYVSPIPADQPPPPPSAFGDD
ncbi:MAG: amidohydrolase [Bacteroidota bacterium]